MRPIPKITNFLQMPEYLQAIHYQHFARFDTAMDAHPGRLLTEFAC
jgi:hypothetical protein